MGKCTSKFFTFFYHSPRHNLAWCKVFIIPNLNPNRIAQPSESMILTGMNGQHNSFFKKSCTTKKNFKIGPLEGFEKARVLYVAMAEKRIAISRRRHFRSTKRKKRKHLESTPQNLRKLTSETTFAYSKVVFRPLLCTNRTINF